MYLITTNISTSKTKENEIHWPILNSAVFDCSEYRNQGAFPNKRNLVEERYYS
jgi:hypothetical protein